MASKNRKKKSKTTNNNKIKTTNSKTNKKKISITEEKNEIIKENASIKVENKDTKSQDMFNILDEDNKNNYKKDNKRILIIILIISILLNISALCFIKLKKPKIKVKTEYKVPENIVFLGDSITDYYDLEKYYSEYNIVNSGISGNKTSDILENMEERVYRYNPSKIFLLIGINDLANEIPKDEIVSNIEEIIKKIKKNRPNAELYVESIYPINDSDNEKINHQILVNRHNEDVIEVNSEIKKYCKEKKVKYIDLYSKLIDEDGNLKLDYTREGLHISDEGYEFLTKELKKYLK